MESTAGVRPRLRDHPQLIAWTVGLALVETVIVWIAAPRAGLALAPQVSAPAPYDVFHDLRWLLVYHESWLGFVAEVFVFVAFRAGATFAIVRRRVARGPRAAAGTRARAALRAARRQCSR